jgi:ferredoxin
MIPVVIRDRCTGCEDCVEVCPSQGITMEDGIAVIHERLCEECGVCVDECPEGAIMLPRPARAQKRASP